MAEALAVAAAARAAVISLAAAQQRCLQEALVEACCNKSVTCCTHLPAVACRSAELGDAPGQSKRHFVLIDVCPVDLVAACVRIPTRFKGVFLPRDASMRALWSSRQNCSHNVSQ